MLKLYGKRQTRAGRCLWALEELGLPYLQIPLDVAQGETRTAAHLERHPLGKVPVLVDGDFVLTESVAINYYLASKHPSALLPADSRAAAQIQQWSSWATTEVEFHFTVMVREIRRAAGGAPNAALINDCLTAVADTLAPLERRLAGGPRYVAGDDFTLGDINAAFPVIGIAPRLDMGAFPATQGWLDRCTARPAWRRVQEIDEESLRIDLKMDGGMCI